MPIAVFSFGSFGDIVAVIQLARSISNALSESAGSSKEYQMLIAELDSFSGTIETVQDAMSSARGLSTSVENAIRHALGLCHGILKDIESKIIGYKESLNKGGTGRAVRDLWRKIGWALFKKEELVEMRRRLHGQLEGMNTLLTLSNWNALERMEKIGHDHHVTLTEIHRCVQELPQKLGYHWECGFDRAHKPIRFSDMLGQTIHLPMELCISPEAFPKLFDRLLRLYFSNRAGRSYVERGDYDLTLQLNDALVDPATWSFHVKPGTSINMNAVLKIRASNLNVAHTWFRVSDSWIEEAPSDPVSSGAGTNPEGTNSAQQPFSSDTHEDDDTRYLRRIRVIPINASVQKAESAVVTITCDACGASLESVEKLDDHLRYNCRPVAPSDGSSPLQETVHTKEDETIAVFDTQAPLQPRLRGSRNQNTDTNSWIGFGFERAPKKITSDSSRVPIKFRPRGRPDRPVQGGLSIPSRPNRIGIR
ncbi:hypothetical protein EW146_g7299 [Bondarzewia mesenterica]|uniref:Ubiquitin-like domain-containing protein n=1 Tax=Bondarzewia mesenterica TaxID=1095465 RepID=A0A4S4LN25_9AGAM|nr:hypothetical protein EW146_g7299 [Bondarzewia mesenterica]